MLASCQRDSRALINATGKDSYLGTHDVCSFSALSTGCQPRTCHLPFNFWQNCEDGALDSGIPFDAISVSTPRKVAAFDLARQLHLAFETSALDSRRVRDLVDWKRKQAERVAHSLCHYLDVSWYTSVPLKTHFQALKLHLKFNFPVEIQFNAILFYHVGQKKILLRNHSKPELVHEKSFWS